MGLLDLFFGKNNSKEVQDLEKPRSKEQVVSSKNQIESHRGNFKADKIEVSLANIDGIKTRFIAIDTETTGVGLNDEVIELGAVKFENGYPVDSFSAFIKIDRHIPDAASRVNHITDDMLRNRGRSKKDVYFDFMSFISDAVNGTTYMIAHNADFDFRYIQRDLSELGYDGTVKYIDTLKLSKDLLVLSNYKQPTIAEYFGIINSAAHRATSDAKACGQILLNLLQMTDGKAKTVIEAKLEKEEVKKEKSKMTDEEREVGGVILSILKDNGVDISKLRFYKNSSRYIDIAHVYTVWKYKIGTKGSYILLQRNSVIDDLGEYNTEPATTSEGNGMIRVYFSSPFELTGLVNTLKKTYVDLMESQTRYMDISPYERQFFANANWSEIGDIQILVENALQRVKDNELAIQQRKQEEAKAKAEKEAKMVEKQRLAQMKAEEAKEKKRQKVEKQQRNLEMAENCDFSIESIAEIVTLAESTNKRAIIKYNDEGQLLRVYCSVSDASADAGVAPKTIRDAASGKSKHAGGFCWIYADEYLTKIQ